MINKIIRKLIMILVIFTLIFTLSGCSDTKAANDNEIYKIYPTQNIWTFIKLDTRDGRMWQLQYAINDDEKRFSLPINEIPMIDDMGKQVGRFTLCPTQNMYNFILLDQISGRTWQIQWSMEDVNRGIIGEIK